MVHWRQHVAYVPVRHSSKDWPSGGEILVRLVGDQARPSTRRQILHREKEQIGRAHEGNRVTVRQQTVKADEVVPLGDREVAWCERSREGQLNAPAKLRLSREQALDRLQQERMGARDDVQTVDATPQYAAPSLGPAETQPEVGVHGAGVDDPEHIRFTRRGLHFEVLGLEANGDGGDRLGRELRH